jgi:inhibitor of the pro-sigma K processing machinery
LIAGGLMGALALWLINQLSGITGIYIAINPFTALSVGFLGLPGALLVVALQYML